MLPDFEQFSLKWKYINGSVWDISAQQTAEREAHSFLCPQPFDGIIMWTSLGRITAYIYHRNCLIRLSLLYPVGFRRKALVAHSVYNLIIHWCELNKPKPSKCVNHMARELEKVLPTHWIFKLGLKTWRTCAMKCSLPWRIPLHYRWQQFRKASKALLKIRLALLC